MAKNINTLNEQPDELAKSTLMGRTTLYSGVDRKSIICYIQLNSQKISYDSQE
jgi:hypothetical protein